MSLPKEDAGSSPELSANEWNCYTEIASLATRLGMAPKDAADLVWKCNKYHEDIYKRSMEVGYKAGDDPDGTKYA